MNILYPIFLKLKKKPVLLVGGGHVAVQKLNRLLTAQATVTVIAHDVCETIAHLAEEGRILLQRRRYVRGDAAGFFLVMGATNDPATQRLVFEDAQSHGIPVNIADVPDLCSFYLSSVFADGDLMIAVSTNGTSPTLGKIIRDRIAEQFGDAYRGLLETLAELRPGVLAAFPDFETRKAVFEQIVRDEVHRIEKGRQRLPGSPQFVKRGGTVALVGAGPGDPELISVKGLKAIHAADVIIHDALVHNDLLRSARPDTEIIYAGKRSGQHCMSQEEINSLMIERAKRGKFVVRLKGGDPFVFGRGGEELQTLRDAGIDVHIIPGITAGTGVPASVGISLTHRLFSASVAFVTGHEDPTKTRLIDWSAVARMDTIVVYMGIRRIREIMAKLQLFGRAPDTPAMVIFFGTLPGETIVTGHLDSIADRAEKFVGDAPGLILVGETVRPFLSGAAAAHDEEFAILSEAGGER